MVGGGERAADREQSEGEMDREGNEGVLKAKRSAARVGKAKVACSGCTTGQSRASTKQMRSYFQPAAASQYTCKNDDDYVERTTLSASHNRQTSQTNSDTPRHSDTMMTHTQTHRHTDTQTHRHTDTQTQTHGHRYSYIRTRRHSWQPRPRRRAEGRRSVPSCR